tara:strand:+ start:558 stop:1913 length:1356 start_codon:yes stop_codon:yes gene_type:complete
VRLVSVLIPIYNVEKYLEKCVRSVMNQSYENLEILCLNDGSTDGSEDILIRLSKEDSRIKIISKPNTGYGHTMNTGLKNASGQYIAIVESDDYIAENMIEEMLVSAEHNCVDFVKTNFFELWDNRVKKNDNLSGLEFGKVLSISECQKLYFVTPSIWSGLYKKSFLDSNNIEFNETPGASFQDVSFYQKTLVKAERILLLNSAYLYYRQDNSNSSIHSENKIFCIIDEFAELSRYIEENGISENVNISDVNRIEFLSYLRIYGSLSEVFRYAFLLRVSEILSRRKMKFDTSTFTHDEMDYYNTLLESPLAFFKKRNDYLNSWLSLINSSSFCLNSKLYINSIEKAVRDSDSYYIYGAGVIGKSIYEYLKLKDLLQGFKGFCVTSNAPLNNVIDNYKVHEFKSIIEIDANPLFLVSTSEKMQFEILKFIKSKGFENTISMNHEVRELINKLN